MYQQNNFNNQQYNEYMQNMMYNTQKRREQRKKIIIDGIIIGATIIASLVIQTAVSIWLKESEYYAVFQNSSVFQYAFNIVAVHICSMAIPFSIMALIMKDRFDGPVIPVKKLKGSTMASWIVIGTALCFVANIVTSALIKAFQKIGYELTQPEYNKPKTPFAFFIMFVSIAVVPAVFEEFAFRCCTLGVLKRWGKGFGVIAVSIIFGLSHGNPIQFIFAFLVGLILGYITVLTDSVIPAMFIHGINNTLTVIQEILGNFLSKTALNAVLAVLIYGTMIIAVIAAVYLIKNHEFFPKKSNKPKDPGELPFLEKLACLLPGLSIPIIILIFVTIQFINPAG